MHRSHLVSIVQCLFLLFTQGAVARHVHHALKHRHHHRQPISFQTTTSLPSSLPTTDNSFLTDIDEIEQGISDLPNDLVSLVSQIAAELQQAENLLYSFLGLSTTSSQVTAPSSPTAGSMSSQTSILPVYSASVSQSMCEHGGAGPLTPCASLESASTSTEFLTSTDVTTSTRFISATSSVLSTFSTASAGTSVPRITPSFQPNISYNSSIIYTNLSSIALPTPTTVASMPSISGIHGVPPNTNTTNITYPFQANASDNVAVYYGSSPYTTSSDLESLCTDSNVNIVILAFITSLSSPSGMPSASFGPGCAGSTAAQQLHAPGLEDCSALAPAIATCQANNKKVLVSIGGSTADISFASASAATAAAATLWNLFGAGTGYDSTLRPFGPNITLDGFDLDNENDNTAYWDVLASSLRTQFALDTSKTHYLSATPQCPFPDQSIPLAAMAVADFVNVQFYNNPSCQLTSDDFQSSYAQWSAAIAGVSNSTMILVGVPAFSGAGSGYVIGSGLETIISQARELETANFGGVMLWDGSGALANVDQYGDDYLVYAKGSLQ